MTTTDGVPNRIRVSVELALLDLSEAQKAAVDCRAAVFSRAISDAIRSLDELKEWLDG